MRKKYFYFIMLLFFALQLIPINRSNPPVTADLIANSKVKSIFKKSCYDCHSYESKYPIYSYIFPISVFLNQHIEEGREELNFSNWENLSKRKKATKSQDIVEEIEKSEMPLFSYRIIHRDAVLSNTEIQIIRNWAEELEKHNESQD